MVVRATRQRLLHAVNDSEVLELVRNLVKIPSHWACFNLRGLMSTYNMWRRAGLTSSPP